MIPSGPHTHIQITHEPELDAMFFFLFSLFSYFLSIIRLRFTDTLDDQHK